MEQTGPGNQNDPAPSQAAQNGPASGPQVAVERLSACECIIRIAADAEYLRERYQKELATVRSEGRLPGFRRGKAPIGLIERRMGSAVRGELVAAVASEGYEKAIEENNLAVVADVQAPDLEQLRWEPGQPLQLEFRCEVLPDLELSEDQYKGLKIDVPILEVTDEMVAREKERFAQRFATWENISGPGIDWDDYVEAQVSVPEAGWSEKLGFYPRSQAVGPLTVEGIKGALLGAKVGDTVEVEAEVSAKGAQEVPALEPLAGKRVKAALAIQAAVRRKVPELTDELAKKIGLSSATEIDSLLRKNIETALAARKEEIARQMALRALMERVQLELPPTLVERAATQEQARLLVRLLRRGVPRQEAERRAEAAAGQTRQSAERQLKAAFLLRKVAEKERILVTESEVEAQIRAFAARQGWRPERAHSYMEERGIVKALRDDMRESKTLEFLVKNARVQEIPLAEFSARYGGPEPEDQEDGGAQQAN